MLTGRLNPATRSAALTRLNAEPLDALVVGGGIAGSSVALDLVTRGLRVALVEADDWAAGASGRTSLVVGGWPDLDWLDPRSLRESVQERARLADVLAPHLVRRTPFLVPFSKGALDRARVGGQALLYDTLAQSLGSGGAQVNHRHLAARTVRRLAPALPDEALTGGVRLSDAVVDDARLVVTLVRTAAAYGAQVVSRASLTELVADEGVITGGRIRDELTGVETTVRARVTVLAAGRATTSLAGDSPAAELAGVVDAPVDAPVFLVVGRSALRSSTGLAWPAPHGLLRATPWGRHWVIGPLAARGAPVDVPDLLAEVNPRLAQPISPAQVQGCFAGSADEASVPPAVLSPGLVRATVNRLASYRSVAARAGDLVAGQLGGLVAGPITERLPLLGAEGYPARWNQRHLLAAEAQIAVARVEHLLNRYGAMAVDLLENIGARPELAAPVPGAADYLAAEIVHAVDQEGAIGLRDVLARRTRVLIEAADGGAATARPVAELMAESLGWDSDEVNAEVADYLSWAAKQRLGWAVG